MVDAPSQYRWSMYKQYITPKEIEKMRKNMKKVPIIQSKADMYHRQEEQEAESLLAKIHNDNKK